MQCLELPIPPLPQFITVGRAVWPVGMKHFRRSFNVFDMLLVNSGTVYMTEDDIAYELSHGDLLVLQPGLVHYGHKPCEVPSEIYWIHFYHKPPLQMIDSRDIPWTTVQRSGTDKDLAPSEQQMYIPKHARIDVKPLLPILDGMLQLHSRFTLEHALELHSLLIQVLSHLQYTASRQLASPSQAVCDKVIRYLNERLAEPFRSEEMEQELHFHYDYMSRCLKKYSGMTPLQYLQHIRMEEAKALLTGSSLTLQEIGEHVGIPDYNYFIRLFSKSVGLSPKLYRQGKRGYA